MIDTAMRRKAVRYSDFFPDTKLNITLNSAQYLAGIGQNVLSSTCFFTMRDAKIPFYCGKEETSETVSFPVLFSLTLRSAEPLSLSLSGVLCKLVQIT